MPRIPARDRAVDRTIFVPIGRFDVQEMFGGQRLAARPRESKCVEAVGGFVSDTQGAAPKAPLLRKS